MKALHLLKTSSGGQWALRQMRELVRLGVEVHAALPPDGPLIPWYRSAGVIVHLFDAGLPTRSPWRWPSLAAELRELVAQVRPDIIHSHFVTTTLTMRLALGRQSVPRIFQVPGPLHLEYTAYRSLELATAGPPDYWVGSCQWTCDRYRASGIRPERVFLSYYGSDLEQFEPRLPGKLRSELKLSPETKVVGMVAFMYAPKRYLAQRRGLKGHEDLIDALVLVLRREPNLVGVFVGGAPEKAADYEAHVRAYGAARCGDRVIFLGTRNDVQELYADMDVAVHPSHSENVGAAVESLLLEVPTIATRTGGLPDLVRDGETGWLVPADHTERLADSILAALRDPVEAQRRAARGRVLASQLLDMRTNARQILEIYRTIVTPASSAGTGPGDKFETMADQRSSSVRAHSQTGSI